MASPHRLAENVPGAYYVTDSCIDCSRCYEDAPAIFELDPATRYSFVFHQPATPEEVALAEETLENCPVEAIQRDGLDE